MEKKHRIGGKRLDRRGEKVEEFECPSLGDPKGDLWRATSVLRIQELPERARFVNQAINTPITSIENIGNLDTRGVHPILPDEFVSIRHVQR
jgi:hypothetical protein